MPKSLTKQLKNLQYGEINPDEKWVIKNRSILLSQIKNTLPVRDTKKSYLLGLGYFFQIFTSFKLIRPLAIALIVVFVIPTVWIARGLAAGDSLPGDTLYPAKRVVEKTQVALVSLIGNKNKEVQLHLELANRRAYEAQKVIGSPERKVNINETVNSLTDELNIVNQKLTDFKNKPESLSNTLVRDVQKQTGEIKTTLQEVKQSLQVSSSSTNEDITKQVALAKDLIKEVDFKTIDAAVNSHLKGNTSLTKDDVQKIVDISLNTAAAEVDNSQQSVEGAKVALETVKTELIKEVASSSRIIYNVGSTSTRELADKISNIVSETSQAANETRAASAEVDKKISEVKVLLNSGNLNEVISKVKEVNEATKEVEKISEITLQKIQTVYPLVQVIKVKESGVPTASTTVSSTLLIVTTTPTGTTTSLFNTTTINSISNILIVVPTTVSSSLLNNTNTLK